MVCNGVVGSGKRKQNQDPTEAITLFNFRFQFKSRQWEREMGSCLRRLMPTEYMSTNEDAVSWNQRYLLMVDRNPFQSIPIELVKPTISRCIGGSETCLFYDDG